MPPDSLFGWVVAFLVPLIQIIGILSALDAVMNSRTPQGSIAWAMALVLVPFFALPAYWVFGRSHFSGYVKVLRDFDEDVDLRLEHAREELGEWIVPPETASDERTASELRGFARLARVPFMCGNSLRLLIDGEETFDAILEAIDRAESYALIQFYIFRDDNFGRLFQQHLIDAVGRGVHVYLLYDEVGCHALPRRYMRTLREAGVLVSSFSGDRGWLGRFRLNFRNHRKIVVADGDVGFTGGFNIGDEYLGHHKRLTPWRDTHVEVRGPAVQSLQLSFVRDWYYGKNDVPELRWRLEASERDQHTLVLPSGPADRLETCALLYSQAINAAEERVWLASPYFVPDGRVLGALQAAALRGVDVRVMVPGVVDKWVFGFVPYAFLPDVDRAGGAVYQFQDGFLHQKVILVDDAYAGVGTANFDNRSFLLNFEITCLAHDQTFCAEVADMLESDFARSIRLTEEDLTGRSFPFRLAVHGTRLLAPVL